MSNFEDFKVLMVSAIGLVISYISTPLEGLRYIVLILTALYTIRRWYLMEKRNRKKDDPNN